MDVKIEGTVYEVDNATPALPAPGSPVQRLGDEAGNILDASGTTGSDLLIGGEGEDLLIAGAGDDVLVGGELQTTGGRNYDPAESNHSLHPDGDVDTFQFNFGFSAGSQVISWNGGTEGRTGLFQSSYAHWLNERLAQAIEEGWQDINGNAIVDMDGLLSLASDTSTAILEAGRNKNGNTVEWDFVSEFTVGSGGATALGFDAGHNKVLDFEWGTDKLAFDGLAGMTDTQFQSLFNVTGNAGALTVSTADGTWSVTLYGAQGTTAPTFDGAIGEDLDLAFFNHAHDQGWLL